eukprot:TRINITY_DN3774_c0_g1_i5.p1 TRINITY_DN3774_c0_g1~~TRINITY_DN3774_c0_g1_i5.p1  ORF type:complete len:494 (-),score=93.93 TRINITY_DN3774_c0_g1_i5:77-1558(-)
MKGKNTLLALVLCCVVLAWAAPPIQVVQTARDTGDRLTPKDPIHWSGTFNQLSDLEGKNIVEVHTDQKKQSVIGFGGAFTESASYIFSKLSAANQKVVLDAYWGPKGLNYTVGRVHMNSCDFSLASYSFDNVKDDFTLANFNISHDEKWLIPFIRAALSYTHINLFLTPWSPPAWMKSNHQMDGSDNPCLIQSSTDVYQITWALYYRKFIEAYKQHGINFWGMTIQNEPEANAPWESCTYTPEQERDFLKYYLGPLLQQYYPDLKIMIYDHNTDHVYKWASTILSDPEAAKYVDGIAFHWYAGPNFENLDKSHEVDTKKFLLATEACNCPTPSIVNGSWINGENYGHSILGDLNHWSAGWTDWNVLLDLQGGPNHLKNYCDSPIRADTPNQILYFQPVYYYMGQFSKFISPKSVVVNSTVSLTTLSSRKISPEGWFTDDLVATAAVTPENNVVVVVVNAKDTAVPFTLVDGKYFANIESPPHSIQTFVYSLLS